jgi:hypothetical protein
MLPTAFVVGMIAFVWLSVPIITVGTLAQSRSASFRAAEAEAMEEVFWQAREPRRLSGIGLGWGLAHNWLSVGMLCTLVAWAYTLGLQAAHAVCGRGPEVGQPLAVVFGLLCLAGAGFWIWLAMFGPGYQPALLSAGYWVAAVGLCCGAVVAGTCCRNEIGHHSPNLIPHSHRSA